MSRSADPGNVHDVAIIGLGPVGAVLGHLCGLLRLDTLIVERAVAIHDLPRAVHFDDEVMRVFQTIGVAEAVRRVSRINPGMRFIDPSGRLLLDWPRPSEIGPQGWHASYRFHQPDLERILRRALAKRQTVSVHLGKALVALEECEDRVDLTLQGEDGASTSGAARFVVGCDGARSLVRRHVGEAVEDLGFHECWLVVDVRLKRPRPDLGDRTIQHCDPAGPATYVRGPGGRRRWEIALVDEAEGSTEPEAVWRRLARWIGPADAEIERAAVYEFHSVLARTWRLGRLVIAGDAAHQTPPFMGQGLCTGLRDVANLAWKLALVLRGRAEAALLDSYQAERAPHARAYVETAVRLGRLVNASDPEAALRAAFLQPDGTARMESLAPPLGSGLTAGDAGAAGRLFPQPRLASGARLDDHAGYGPVLVTDSALWSAAGAPASWLAERGVALATADGAPEVAAALAGFAAGAAMVRPDRYVLGTAADPATLCALIEGTPAAPA